MDALRKLQADYWLPIHPKVRKGILFTTISLIVVVIALSSLNSQPEAVAYTPTDTASSIQTAMLVVHIVGEVNNPGVFELPANSR
ncbi:MAG: hypothetical protein ACKOWE_02920, partial [Micrococcales bacterium]